MIRRINDGVRPEVWTFAFTVLGFALLLFTLAVSCEP